MRVFKPAFCGAPAPAFSTLLKASRSKTDAFNVDLELSHVQLKSNSRLVHCPVPDCGGGGRVFVSDCKQRSVPLGTVGRVPGRMRRCGVTGRSATVLQSGRQPPGLCFSEAGHGSPGSSEGGCDLRRPSPWPQVWAVASQPSLLPAVFSKDLLATLHLLVALAKRFQPGLALPSNVQVEVITMEVRAGHGRSSCRVSVSGPWCRAPAWGVLHGAGLSQEKRHTPPGREWVLVWSCEWEVLGTPGDWRGPRGATRKRAGRPVPRTSTDGTHPGVTGRSRLTAAL